MAVWRVLHELLDVSCLLIHGCDGAALTAGAQMLHGLSLSASKFSRDWVGSLLMTSACLYKLLER